MPPDLCRRMMFEVAGHAICVSDVTGRIVFWSRGAADLFGWGPDEILPFAQEPRLIPGAAERQEAELLGRAPAEGWYARRDGSRFWGSGTLTALRERPDGPARWFVLVLRDATEQHEGLRRVEEDRDQEHRVADALQRAQFPDLSPDGADGLRVAGRYCPAHTRERVGGDFYDALPLEGGAVALFVGDAAGKGLAAANRAAEVRFTLRAFLREDPDPSRAVSRVNELLCRARRIDRAEEDGPVFTTLTLAVAYPRGGAVHFVTAGGERPVLVRSGPASTTRQRIESVDDGADTALGILSGVTFPAATRALAPGDSLLLFTDGITEARRGREFFGADGVRRVLCGAFSTGTMSAEEIASLVLTESGRFAGSASDDRCVLAANLL